MLGSGRKVAQAVLGTEEVRRSASGVHRSAFGGTRCKRRSRIAEPKRRFERARPVAQERAPCARANGKKSST
jgi:hypothetical protein